MFENIKWLFFDVGSTLVDETIAYEHRMRDIAVSANTTYEEVYEKAMHTYKLMFRAFGCIENPSYTEYKEFLESRCFPRTRDKMKLVLKDLDLPFYDYRKDGRQNGRG